jgi:Fic family protein
LTGITCIDWQLMTAMDLFRPPELDAAELEVVQQLDLLRNELRYATERSVRWSGSLSRAMRARAVLGSNSIEGYELPADEGLSALHGEEPTGTTNETWLAVNGYQHAMTYVLQLADDPHFEWSKNLIRSMHYMMLSYDLRKNPGRWRPGPMYVRNEQKQEIVYEAPPSDMVVGLMDRFIDSLKAEGENRLIRAAMAHLNLVMIHPFSDGNGRMARCLQTLCLARSGVIEQQFCSIEEWLGRHTAEYYEVLSQVGRGSWHPENDARPWIRFNLTAHFQQAELLRVRAERTSAIWEQLEEIITVKGLPDRCIYALFDAAVGFRVRNATYRAGAEVSEQVASRDLKAMVDAGLLEAIGEARGRSYKWAPQLYELWKKTREEFPYVANDPFVQGPGIIQKTLF